MATKFLVGCSRRTASHSCMTICNAPYESVLVQVLNILCVTCGILTHGLVAQTGSAAGF